MEINERTYGKIRHILPVQRGRVTVQNITLINALLYICKNGCKWRRLPKEYGNSPLKLTQESKHGTVRQEGHNGPTRKH